jgi:hypothetical protein
VLRDCRKRQDFLVEREKIIEWINDYLKLDN